MGADLPDVAVLGAGRSGLAAARLARALGHEVRVYETGKAAEQPEQQQPLREMVEGMGAELVLQLPQRVREGLAVISPGLDPRTPLARLYDDADIEVVAELEFAWQQVESPVLAVTGTNGKTTTVEMIAHIMRATSARVSLGGNHGKPLSEIVLEHELGDKGVDWHVLEVSSFQLERLRDFAPRVVVWTNFAADHMDRYGSLQEYRRAKQQIFARLDVADRAVVPWGERLDVGQATRVEFGALELAHFSFEKGALRAHGLELGKLDDLRVRGRHNALNALAALAAVEATGVHAQLGFQLLRDFSATAHRYELIETVLGVQYINDSKATNLHALASALAADSNRLHLLAGGFDKGLDWSDLCDCLPQRLCRVYAYGATAEAIAKAWGELVEVVCFVNLDEAFSAAVSQSSADDQVLLSPGTSSFDQFSNYMTRGDHFRDLVAEYASFH